MDTSIQSTPISYSRHFRETIKLSVPVIVGQLGFVLMGVIDNMMIGDLGYEYLSASSLANGIFFVVTIIGMGISMILSPLTAEAEGAGKYARAGNYLIQGLLVSVALAVVIMIANYFSTGLLYVMDQPERDVELAHSYLQILGLSIIPFLLFLASKSFVDGLSFTKPAMYITLLGLGCNVFANWLLIYGNWGVPRLELDGAGYGTLISRVFMMGAMLGYIMYAKRFKKYWVKWQGIQWHIVKKILRLGIPSGLQWFFEVGAFVGAAIMIGWFQPEDLAAQYRAAHQIAISMASVSFMVVVGISAGATIRVGDALGKKDEVSVRRSGFAGIILAIGFMVFSAMIFVIGREWLPSLFLDLGQESASGIENQKVLATASSLMLIAALFQVFDGAQAVGAGILRGIQDVKIPTLITFVAYWVIALPLCYFLGFTMELEIMGFWYSFVVSLMISASLLVWRFSRFTLSSPQAEELLIENLGSH